MNAELDFQLALEEAELLSDVPCESDILKWVNAALKVASIEGTTQLTVRVVDEEEMTTLNKTYRQKDGSTNVLSFPFEAPAGVDLPLIGDVVICAQVVAREAQQQDKPQDRHWAHMVIHGTLHLLGYDHILNNDAEKMEKLEINILSQLGYPDPYQTVETI